MTLVFDEVWVREPRLLVPRKVPLSLPRIVRENPLAQDLRFAIITIGGTPVEVVRGVPLTATGGAGVSPMPDGLTCQAAVTGTKYWSLAHHPSYALTGAMTVMCRFVQGASSTYYGVASKSVSSGGATTPFDIYNAAGGWRIGRANAGGYRFRGFLQAAPSAGDDITMGFSYPSAEINNSGAIAIFNGVKKATSDVLGAGTGDCTDGGGVIKIGSRDDNVTINNQSTYYLFGWARHLGEVGMGEIHRDPFQVFA